MLHHIVPGSGGQSGFAPNAGLEITPEFLDAVIVRAIELGYDLVSLDDAVRRLETGEDKSRPFAVFTIDDGYRDNLEFALPVFQRHNCPFTLFIAPGITDGTCELWWRGLEEIVNSTARLQTSVTGEQFDFPTESGAQKLAAFERIYWPVRNLPEHEQRSWIRRVSQEHNIDLDAMCRSYAMNWDELREVASDPLCMIGAHTTNHFAIARLSLEEATYEAVSSRDRIEKELGRPVGLFAYPYGDETSAGPRDFALIRDAGFRAAVTTRKGLVYEQHRDHLTALPRVSLNGGFQKLRYLDVLLSGTAFAVWNGFQTVSVS
jgi:peptidoglycan/xylan/chitin deacetylase (PgdA/CDA1 family)